MGVNGRPGVGPRHRSGPSTALSACLCLCDSLSMVLPLEVSLPLLEEYDAEFQRSYEEKMRAKLGILGEAEAGEDEGLFKVCVDFV